MELKDVTYNYVVELTIYFLDKYNKKEINSLDIMMNMISVRVKSFQQK